MTKIVNFQYSQPYSAEVKPSINKDSFILSSSCDGAWLKNPR